MSYTNQPQETAMTTPKQPDLLQHLTDYMSHTLKLATFIHDRWRELVKVDPAKALRRDAAVVGAAGKLSAWSKFFDWVSAPGQGGLTHKRALEYATGVLCRPLPRHTNDVVEDARAADEFDVQRKIAAFLLTHIISAMEG